MTPPHNLSLPLFGALLALAPLWGGCQLSPLCEASFEGGAANACGGCALLEGDPGDPCGHRSSGALVCSGSEALRCEGAKTLEDVNSCGGFEDLPGEAGHRCGGCDLGIWECLGPDEMVCGNDPGDNGCGGCGALPSRVGEPCGVCETGSWQCEGTESLVCQGERPGMMNACGECGVLEHEPGEPCGACGEGVWACGGLTGAMRCEGAARPNACGGCGELSDNPGGACGECGLGVLACEGQALVCQTPQAGSNACGGCTPLGHDPGDPCGPCGRDAYVCAAPDVIVCDAATGCFADIPPDFIMVSLSDDDQDMGLVERRGFTLQTTPVTRDQWRRSMSPQTPPQSLQCADCPQQGLSWADAVAFVNQMSFDEGLEACYDVSECTGEPGGGLECGEISFRGPGCEGWRLPSELERAHILDEGQAEPIGLAEGPLDTADLDGERVLRPVRSF